jgi:hypothetical protein
LIPVSVHRRAFDRAFSEWIRNPTPATQAQLEVERRENQKIALRTEAFGTVVLFLGFNVVRFCVATLAGYLKKTR